MSSIPDADAKQVQPIAVHDRGVGNLRRAAARDALPAPPPCAVEDVHIVSAVADPDPEQIQPIAIDDGSVALDSREVPPPGTGRPASP